MLDKIRYVFAKSFKILLNPPMLNHCNKHKTARVCPGAELTNVIVGRYTYLGSRSYVVNTQIGAFCSIADQVTIGGAEHPTHFISTSPVFLKGNNVLKKNFSEHSFVSSNPTIIENDVWIGRNATIKAGVRVSTGAVIGSNSMVTKDVGPYEIWAGNPACLIRKRFDDDMIDKLLNLKWWEYDEAALKVFAQTVTSPESVINR
jgi:acetyltransferase-like isoleucine patch superfamily enzyme